MRYRKKARNEVRDELIDHFEEHLRDCVTNEEKEQKAQQLISEFGDAKVLAILMRRAKKRCRPLWQKILVRSSAAGLVIVAYLLICVSWLRMGSPTIRVNYAQWLTDQQRQGRDESLNAKPEIDKAGDSNLGIIFSHHFGEFIRKWPGDMNEDQKAETKKVSGSKIMKPSTSLKLRYENHTSGMITIHRAQLLSKSIQFL